MAIHSLLEMIQGAGKKANALTGLIDDARELDLHYVPSRYPNGLPSGYPHQFYGKSTAEKALRAADKIFGSVWNYLLAKVENFREPSSRSSAVTNVSS